MPSGFQLVAFVGSSDLELARRFYEDSLGLELIGASEFARVFDAGGSELRVTLVERPARAPYTVLGWRVPDIAAAIARLTAAGVAFKRYEGMAQDPDGVWTAPSGSRIAWFEDPDGNVISLQEAPAEVSASDS